MFWGDKMTVKEKVIRQAIKKIERRIKYINSIIEAEPLKAIIEIRKEAQKLIKSNKPASEQIRIINKLQKEETKQLNIIEKQMKLGKYLEEKAQLMNELSQLNSELYWIENDKKRRKNAD